MTTPPEAGDDRSMRRRQNVEARPLPDGAVLVDMETGRCFELNRVGAEIWELLASAVQLSSLSETLAARYRQDPRAVRRDVERLVTDLLGNRLIEDGSAP